MGKELLPGKEELGFVEYVLKCYILIGRNIIRNHYRRQSFAIVFLEEANTAMKRQ